MPGRLSWTLPVLVVSAVVIGACGSDEPDGSGDTITVTGQLTYRQRIALPPGSTATVVLEDISLADAPATVVAEQVIDLDGRQVPIPFELEVDPSGLDTRFSYSVRGTVTGPDGALLWTTDTVTPVDPGAGSTDLGALTMVQVAAS